MRSAGSALSDAVGETSLALAIFCNDPDRMRFDPDRNGAVLRAGAVGIVARRYPLPGVVTDRHPGGPTEVGIMVGPHIFRDGWPKDRR